MKSLGLIGGLVVALILAAGGLAWADMGGGFGPWGRMMDHTSPGPGGSGGWHNMGFSVSGLTLTKEQAAQIAQTHLRAFGNPNLKLGEVIEFEPYYEALIVTKDGSLVEKLLVDKRTGWLRSVYQ